MQFCSFCKLHLQMNYLLVLGCRKILNLLAANSPDFLSPSFNEQPINSFNSSVKDSCGNALLLWHSNYLSGVTVKKTTSKSVRLKLGSSIANLHVAKIMPPSMILPSIMSCKSLTVLDTDMPSAIPKLHSYPAINHISACMHMGPQLLPTTSTILCVSCYACNILSAMH